MTERKPSVRLLRKALDRLYAVTEQAVLLSSRSKNYSHTGRQLRVHAVFTKLIAHNMSLALLVSKLTEDEDEGVLDHFSIATLGRASIDAALMTMYLSEPSLSRDAWDFRRQLLFLHDIDNRSRFLKPLKKRGVELGFFVNKDEIRAGIKARIRELGPTLGYSPEQVEEYANGKHMFMAGARGAAREAGWDTNEFEFLQSYLSAHVHSHPVSYMRVEEHKIRFGGASKFQIQFCVLIAKAAAAYTEGVNERIKTFGVPMTGDPVGQLE